MNLFKTKMTAIDDSRVTICKSTQVSWNHGLKNPYNKETLKKISEGVKNGKRAELNSCPIFRQRQSEITKNSEAVRIARLESRAKAEATKKLPGGYYDRRSAKAVVKDKTPKQPRQPKVIKEPKNGKGLREGVAMGTPLMTPEGLFASRAEYIRFTGLTGASISQRIRKYPQHYFYLD